MAGLLLGLRREIARNRRRESYATRYVPRTSPAPAASARKVRPEPENLDELRVEKAVKSFSEAVSQTGEKDQTVITEEKLEDKGKMEDTESRESEVQEDMTGGKYVVEEPVFEETLEEKKPITHLTPFNFSDYELKKASYQEDQIAKEESEEESEEETNDSSENEIVQEEMFEEETKEENTEEEKVEEAAEEETIEDQVPEVNQEEPEETPESEELHGPKPFDFSAYESKSEAKADMVSNGVKPFDFEQYRKTEALSSVEEEALPAETVREDTVRSDSKEDFLLKEIDEFRERAKRLQMLLDNRETEAEKLQSIVDERQEKADALQEKADELDQILQDRQKEADGITAQVERQIDALIAKVSLKMDELEASMSDQNEDGRRFSEQKAKELKEALAQIQEQLTTLKAELSDKVHTENVKCFRNISDLLKGTEQKIDAMSEIEDKIAPVKLLGISSLVVGIINFVAIIILMIVNMISSGAVG